MSRRVQVLGYYGMANFGDDLFRQVVTENAGKLWPGASARTFAPMGLHRPYGDLGRIGSATRLAAGTLGAAWADTFALCGGSVLQSVSGVQSLRRKLVGRRRFEALGVSVGPFDDPADGQEVLDFLSHFDRVIVRDTASAQRLGGDVTVGGDLAALVGEVPRHNPDTARGLTICPSDASGTSAEELTGQVLDGLGGRDIPVNVLALNHHHELGDEGLSNEVAGGLREAGLGAVEVHSYRRLGVDGVIRFLAGSLAVWTQRLHGGIVSYLVGTPFVIVGHHAKCRDFASDIGLDPSLVLPTRGGDWSGASKTLEHPFGHWQLDPDEYMAKARSTYLKESV